MLRALLLTDETGEFNLQTHIYIIHEVHHQDVFGCNRAVSLKREAPVPILLLQRQKCLTRPTERAFRRCLGCYLVSVWPPVGGSLAHAVVTIFLQRCSSHTIKISSIFLHQKLLRQITLYCNSLIQFHHPPCPVTDRPVSTGAYHDPITGDKSFQRHQPSPELHQLFKEPCLCGDSSWGQGQDQSAENSPAEGPASF